MRQGEASDERRETRARGWVGTDRPSASLSAVATTKAMTGRAEQTTEIRGKPSSDFKTQPKGGPGVQVAPCWQVRPWSHGCALFSSLGGGSHAGCTTAALDKHWIVPCSRMDGQVGLGLPIVEASSLVVRSLHERHPQPTLSVKGSISFLPSTEADRDAASHFDPTTSEVSNHGALL